jgi:hypothetical protein
MAEIKPIGTSLDLGLGSLGAPTKSYVSGTTKPLDTTLGTSLAANLSGKNPFEVDLVGHAAPTSVAAPAADILGKDRVNFMDDPGLWAEQNSALIGGGLGVAQMGLGLAGFLDNQKTAEMQRTLLGDQITNNREIMANRKAKQDAAKAHYA